MKRRDFLGLCGKASALIALSGLRTPVRAAYGDILDPAVWNPMLPACKILEVYLYGGLSAWETFYHKTQNDSGQPAADPWQGFASEVAALNWSCAAGGPSTAAQTEAFGQDGMGRAIRLGPATKPLWASHIRNKMRVIVHRHNLEPHEAAVPYALSGLRLGRPELAGLGSPIQRRWLEISPRAEPYSYVCIPQVLGFPNDNWQAAAATGQHPGSSRPLVLRIGTGSGGLLDLLERPAVVSSGTTSRSDDLLKAYRAQYRRKAKWAGAGDVLRSKGLASYEASANSLFGSLSLRNLLDTAPLSVSSSAPCPAVSGTPSANDVTGASLRTAAYLLSHPTHPARYACVVDGGLVGTSGGGYDTHSSHAPRHFVNLWSTLQSLASVIQDPALPAQPGKINLSDTLVVLNTEFGRTPQNFGGGRNHWPQGYVTALIGGPITTPGVVGAMDDAGHALDGHWYTPTAARAAALLAAGVYPFGGNSIYGVGDIGGHLMGTEAQTAINIRTTLLGV